MENTGQEGQHLSLPDNATFIKAKVRLGVTRLFKNYLFAFEEFVTQHDEAMKKLEDALPADLKVYVSLADYISEESYEMMRKKILSAGNDVIRDVESTVDGLQLDREDRA